MASHNERWNGWRPARQPNKNPIGNWLGKAVEKLSFQRARPLGHTSVGNLAKNCRRENEPKKGLGAKTRSDVAVFCFFILKLATQ